MNMTYQCCKWNTWMRSTLDWVVCFVSQNKRHQKHIQVSPLPPKDVNPRAVISFRGVILIVGKHGLTPAARDISPEELRAKAGLIEPWFDYSKPKRLGVRRNE